jgi:phosphoribosylglycinamide formyltransferase-1
MNIHPSLLPAFKGWDRNVHKDVLGTGCKVSGCSLFFVTNEPDAGPIIAQKAVEVSEDETVDSLKEKVQKAEQEIILRAIKLFAAGKLKVEGRKVRILG